MFSRMVARQLEEAVNMGAAALKNADQVAERLADHFALQDAGPEQPDWKGVIETLGRKLIEASEEGNRQEAAYQTELRLERQLKERREEVVLKVRSHLKGARFLLDETFGKNKAAILFPLRSDLTRITPRNLVPLARSMSLLLRGSGVDWPPLDEEGHLLKPLELADRLDGAADQLDGVLGDLVRVRKGNVFLLGQRRAEFRDFTRVISTTAPVLSGLFKAAGFDFAAQRLRTPQQRRAR